MTDQEKLTEAWRKQMAAEDAKVLPERFTWQEEDVTIEPAKDVPHV